MTQSELPLMMTYLYNELGSADNYTLVFGEKPLINSSYGDIRANQRSAFEFDILYIS